MTEAAAAVGSLLFQLRQYERMVLGEDLDQKRLRVQRKYTTAPGALA